MADGLSDNLMHWSTFSSRKLATAIARARIGA